MGILVSNEFLPFNKVIYIKTLIVLNELKNMEESFLRLWFL
jgi:hypothetical protein